MTRKELKLPIDSVARRLGELPNAERVREYARGHTAELTYLIVHGFSQLIDRFNVLDEHSPVMDILPGTKHLKKALRGTRIPRPENFTPRDILAGVGRAVPPMIIGHRLKNEPPDKDPTAANEAIGTPSMNTSETALAVGTAGHILERTIFHVMGWSGVKLNFTKDEVLFALEEMALLMHEEQKRGFVEDPKLFGIITAPNAQGGLGWRTKEQVEKFSHDYAALFSKE